MMRSAAASIIRQVWPDAGRIRVIEVVEQPDLSVDVLMQTRSMPGRAAGRPIWISLSREQCGRGLSADPQEA
jgi:hypothetical protein